MATALETVSKMISASISFGGYYACVEKYVRAARYCEEAGLSGVWIADSQMIHRDPYECLALCATATRKIQLGTAVTNPVTRDVTVTACAIATLNEVSGGRAILGIGPGDSSVRRIGQKPASVETLGKSIKTIRKICAGEAVEFPNGEQVSMRWSSDQLTVFVSATGKKMLKLAGELGDGAIVNVGSSPQAMEDAIETLRHGAGERFRNFNVADLTFINIAENRRDALEAARPYVIWYWRNAPRLFELNGLSPEKLKAEFEAFERDYVAHDHIHSEDISSALAESSFISDEMVRKFAIAGTPEDCIRMIKEKERLGVKSFIARHTGNEREWEIFLRTYCEQVVPGLR